VWPPVRSPKATRCGEDVIPRNTDRNPWIKNNALLTALVVQEAKGFAGYPDIDLMFD